MRALLKTIADFIALPRPRPREPWADDVKSIGDLWPFNPEGEWTFSKTGDVGQIVKRKQQDKP